jgi:hypothetical protein
LRANVPRRRPAAVTSSFTSHTSPSAPRVSGIQAALALALTIRKPSRSAGGRRLDKVKEEATAAGGRRGTFVQTPATCAAAQTFAVTVAVDAGVVERWRERGLAANVPRRRPAAVTSSFTSHPAPAPSACQASRRPRQWLSTTRKPSRCVGGPNARNESDRSSTKNPGRCRGFSFGTARAPYFFFGMYRSVIVPS